MLWKDTRQAKVSHHSITLLVVFTLYISEQTHIFFICYHILTLILFLICYKYAREICCCIIVMPNPFKPFEDCLHCVILTDLCHTFKITQTINSTEEHEEVKNSTHTPHTKLSPSLCQTISFTH